MVTVAVRDDRSSSITVYHVVVTAHSVRRSNYDGRDAVAWLAGTRGASFSYTLATEGVMWIRGRCMPDSTAARALVAARTLIDG